MVFALILSYSRVVRKNESSESGLVLYEGNQSIMICLDVEYHTATLENARLRVSRLNILRRSPLR
jgi:hypothetical protein